MSRGLRNKIKQIVKRTGSLGGRREATQVGLQYFVLFLILFAGSSFFLWNVSTTISKGYREQAKFDQISKETEDVLSEVEKLRDDLSYAQSDRSAEEGARNVLGMVFSGEEVIFVDGKNLPKDPDSSVEPSEDVEDTRNRDNDHLYKSNFEAWVKLFFY